MAEEILYTFTSDERSFAGFLLELENNAMLRMILVNQEKIMTKLDLPFDVSAVYDALAPIEKTLDITSDDRFEADIKNLTLLRRDRLWEWAQLKLSISDSNQKKK